LLGVPLIVVVLLSRLRGGAMRRRQAKLVRLVEDRTAELRDANAHLLRLSRIEHDKKLADEQRAHAENVARMNRRAIETLALAIEAKDKTTRDHLERVEVYAVGVAQELVLSETQLEALRAAALLHDVGKLAVPDNIISKPGRLTPEEFEKMKIHTVVGAEIVEQMGFPYPVAPIVRSHHEKWNGLGYPDGLSGKAIPIGARILAAVDCLDERRVPVFREGFNLGRLHPACRTVLWLLGSRGGEARQLGGVARSASSDRKPVHA
jgi:putative nucleotidyltransferase with HDIG domain